MACASRAKHRTGARRLSSSVGRRKICSLPIQAPSPMSKSRLGAVKASGPLSALLFALVGCASSGTPIDRDIDLVLSPSVELVLATHRSSLPVLSELVAVDAVVTIDHKGNLGRVDTSEQQQAFQWQADGRLASTSTGSYKTPDGSMSAWTSTSTSLCGLVPLLTESASRSVSRLTTAVPAGGVFVPFGFSSESKGASRARLVSFSTSATNLCKPTPGASFTFQSTREEQRRFEGKMLSSNKLHTITESATCMVGPTEQSAKALNPSLVGGYLLVSCSYSDASKSPRKSEFAFLLSSGLYVPVSVQLNEYQTNGTRYTAVRYK